MLLAFFLHCVLWGFFLYLCCWWAFLLVLKGISSHYTALHLSLLTCTCVFQTFSSTSQDHSHSTNSFFCYHILFLSNQLTAFKFSSWVLFCLVIYMEKQKQFAKNTCACICTCCFISNTVLFWQYLVQMGMFRKICRSRWKTSLENSEGQNEPVELWVCWSPLGSSLEGVWQ